LKNKKTVIFKFYQHFLLKTAGSNYFRSNQYFFCIVKFCNRFFFFLNIALRTHPTHLLFVKMHPISPKLWYISPQVWFRSKKDKKIHWKTGFFFKQEIKLSTTCLPVSIEIVPPFSTLVQHSASPQAIQKFFRVVQSQCLQVHNWQYERER
jgi:hypothetical protein